MKRAEAWTVHLSMVLVGGTGLVYAWMRYFAKPSDPYAIVNHPWQPTLQHLHIWVAPLLVFCAGLIWRSHIWNHWRRGVRSGRRSGIGMTLSLFPMILSGYLIQTAVSDSWRNAWVTIHLVTSGLFAVGYLIHLQVQRQRKQRRKQQGLQPELSPG
ncbi:MAG: hypothetical protein AAF657_24825 [Acidobacteriota bacterium]